MLLYVNIRNTCPIVPIAKMDSSIIHRINSVLYPDFFTTIVSPITILLSLTDFICSETVIKTAIFTMIENNSPNFIFILYGNKNFSVN